MKKLITTLIITFSLGFFAKAADFYSIGSGNWSTASNWSTDPSGLPVAVTSPSSGDRAFIRNSDAMTVTSAVSCTEIIMTDNSTLNISTGASLTIEGPSTWNTTVGILNQGELIFDASGATQLAEVNQDLSIIGVNGVVEVNNNLTFFGSGQFRIGGILKPINGTITTAGLLTLSATGPLNFGRVELQSGGTPHSGTISGDVTIEKVFDPSSLISSQPVVSGGFSGKWFQMCFPMSTTVGSADWQDITFNHSGTTPAIYRNIYWWDASDVGGQVAAGWTEATASDDNTKAYTAFLTTDGPFVTGQGATPNKISGKGQVDISTDPVLQSVTYTLDTQNPGGTAANAQGWNLLRNPWPTSIDMDELMGNTVDFNVNYYAYHVWNTTSNQYDAIPNSAFSGGFIPSHVDYNDPDGFVINGDSTRRIMPFQAFWVKCNAVNKGPITLRKIYTDTKIDANSVYMKTSGSAGPLATVFAYDTDSMKDITLFYYHQDVTKQFDQLGDLYKLKSIDPNVPTLNIIESGTQAQVAGHPHASVDTVFMRYSSAKNNTTAYLHLHDAELGSTYQVMLHDKVTGNTIDFTANPDYMFTHNTNNPEDRFVLYVTNSAFDIAEYNPAAKPMEVYTTGDELVIESKSYSGPAHLTMYDMAGRRVMTKQIETTEGAEMRVQMPGLASAIYNVEIEFDGRVMVEKVVK